ncbi:MAG TPA: UvrD-helicase domain-containing protein, partial [Rhizomicrobium sp.]
MSDDTVRAALRSDAPLVAIEAPAGCGKTHQGADYALEMASGSSERILILTHTHAACSVFATRTAGSGRQVEIRTLDGLVSQIATAYHSGLGLPANPAIWARQNSYGYADVARRVATLLDRHPMIVASLAQRYPVVICDEHQDCSGDQHSLSMALLARGSRVRIFADPMQRIFREKTLTGSRPAWQWGDLVTSAQIHEQLDTPHRWKDGCPLLGQWTLRARATLMAGGTIDLRDGVPPSVSVIFAENQSQRNLDYRLAQIDRRA